LRACCSRLRSPTQVYVTETCGRRFLYRVSKTATHRVAPTAFCTRPRRIPTRLSHHTRLIRPMHTATHFCMSTYSWCRLSLLAGHPPATAPRPSGCGASAPHRCFSVCASHTLEGFFDDYCTTHTLAPHHHTLDRCASFSSNPPPPPPHPVRTRTALRYMHAFDWPLVRVSGMSGTTTVTQELSVSGSVRADSFLSLGWGRGTVMVEGPWRAGPL